MNHGVRCDGADGGPLVERGHEVAAVFSDVLDRPITYPRPSLLGSGLACVDGGEPPGFILLMCDIDTTARLGFTGRVTRDARRILGRQPRDMQAFVEDHAEEFLGGSDSHGR